MMLREFMGNSIAVQFLLWFATLFFLSRFRSIRVKSKRNNEVTENYFFIFLLLSSVPFLSITNSFFRFYGTSSIASNYQLGVAISMFLIVFPLVVALLKPGKIFFSTRNSNQFSQENALLLIVFLACFVGVIQGLALDQGWIQSLFVFSALTLSIKLKQNWTPTVYLLGIYMTLAVTFASIGLKITFLEPLSNCRSDKCGLSPLVLSGNHNGLGILFLFVGLLLLSLEQKKYDFFNFFFISLILLLTASRTSIFCFVAVSLLKLCLNGLAKERGFLLLKISALFSFLLSIYPVFSSWGGEELTYRGILWQYSKSFFSESWVIGNGPSFWVRLGRQNNFDANYGAHNIWLDAGVAQGVIGVFFLGGFLLLLYRMIIRSENMLLLIPFSGILITGFSESVFSLNRYSFAIPILVILIQASKSKSIRLKSN